ncbi:MAG: HAD family hydrolase [Planctomycetota bacterium]
MPGGYHRFILAAEEELVQAILFDLFGTLVPNLPLSCWENSSDSIARTLGVDPQYYRQLWEPRFMERMTGDIPDGEKQFDSILETAGINASASERMMAAQLHTELLREALVPKPDACQVLSDLVDRGLRLGLVTDCSSSAPQVLDQTPLGPFFEARSISAFLGVRKPDPRMYSHVLELLRVSGENCIYVGDGNSEELLGAKKFGMTTVWVDNGVEQHWRERFVPQGDYTIRSLAELIPILDSLERTTD